MSYYQVDELVQATCSAQNLQEGELYRVLAVDSQMTPFGEFVTYVVQHVNSREPVSVRNGHLLLRRSNR